jgi:hypothetical protein
VKITHSIAIGAKRRDRDNSTNDVRGKGRSRSNGGPSHQCNTNWGHEEIMALISYKHKEQIVLKQVIDPRANMILTIQQWNKFSNLQAITHSKTPRIGKMCKDKWNYIHGDYKRISNYHTSIGNNTSY